MLTRCKQHLIGLNSTYQVKPAHGDWDSANLPLPALPHTGLVGAVVEVKDKDDGSDVADPFDEILEAKVQHTGLKGTRKQCHLK